MLLVLLYCEFRYKLVLCNIRNEVNECLKSEPSNKFFHALLMSCQYAISAMHEINMFLNYYKRDMEYKASVRHLSYNITNMPTLIKLDTDYGKLEFEASVHFKKRKENKYYNCLLLCFQFRIFVFTIEVVKTKGKGRAFGYKSCKKENYVYSHSLEVNEMMTVMKQEGKPILNISYYDQDFTENTREGFDIKEKYDPSKTIAFVFQVEHYFFSFDVKSYKMYSQVMVMYKTRNIINFQAIMHYIL